MEIKLSNILDYIPKRLEYLQSCVSKLRFKGVLSVSGVDIIELSKLIITGKYTTDEINNILYHGKQSSDCLQRISAMINNIGLQVVDKRISGVNYYLKGIKT
jgi:hypothetical protein